MDNLTPKRVRSLTARELGAKRASISAATGPLPPNDPILTEVKNALSMDFAGVILSGPPGTGKTWYAKQIAEALTEDPKAIRTVQFHPSYQYEDFMEGYAPTTDGGFVMQLKVFLALCEDAAEQPDIEHVLIIEELSRCDVARVFGEALTYVEVDKRGLPFTLASGAVSRVPENLVILATLNPWDKGVDELDVALERRFAQIDMPPSAAALRNILERNGAESTFIDRVVTFFEGVQSLDEELCHLGHAYFRNCVDETSARRAWAFRLHPFFKRACRLDRSTLESIERMWNEVVPVVESETLSEEPIQPIETNPDNAS